MLICLIIFVLFFILTFLANKKLSGLIKKLTTKDIEQSTLNDSEIEKLSEYFVNKEEKYLSSLGNGYIMNFIANRSLKRGFAVISDKRVYFRGSCYSGQGKNLKQTEEERTVDIKDITGSGFIYTKYIGILLGLFIILTTVLIGSILVLCNGYGSVLYYWRNGTLLRRINSNIGEFISMSAIAGICIPFVIFCFSMFLNYLKKRKTLFQIQYAGGNIAFDVSFYAKAEIEDFQKQLRRAKDYVSKNAISPNRNALPVETTNNDTADNLRKYAELLKDGLISQEEYEAMKKKLLGL